MTSFDDRTSLDKNQRADTARYAREEEMEFRIHARRNRLLGTWAAERMHLSPAEGEAYAKSVVQADFEESSDEDVVRKVLGDLILAGVEADEGEVRAALKTCETDARRAMLGSA